MNQQEAFQLAIRFHGPTAFADPGYAFAEMEPPCEVGYINDQGERVITGTGSKWEDALHLKCIVSGCKTYLTVADGLCNPCKQFLQTGVGNDSAAYSLALKAARDYLIQWGERK